MVDITTSFIIDNDVAFQAGLDRMARATNDFRVPFNLIRAHWYKGNRKIFTLKSSGLYPDYGGFNPSAVEANGLSRRELAKSKKMHEVGFVYPMLVRRSRRLMRSLISDNASGSESFVGRKVLSMGTSISYAKYHQSDRPRKTLPQRKIIFIDGGPAETAKDALVSGRREAWLNIMNDYINDFLEG